MDSRSTHDASPGAPASPNRPELSDREREILILTATGASNKLIAQQLAISPNTVKVHLRNIFAKLGVASRTEAALYAIREGLVQVNGELPAVAAEGGPADVSSAPEVVAAPAPRRWGIWLALALIATAVVVLSLWSYNARPPTPTAVVPTNIPPTAAPRWRATVDLPTARAGLAVTTYGDHIYAIGGETSAGITGAVERFDPATGAWDTLTSKPLAVADVGAVVIGGQIYVPGGRLASGASSDTLEVYNPTEDRWETRASLPRPVSGYMVAAFEGRLFMFGGWDGSQYVDTVLVYDPSADTWAEASPMPTARGFGGAAVAGGRIYVMGGTAGDEPLTVSEQYTPEADQSGGQPWKTATPLPQGRARFGLASIADIIHVVGGTVTPGVLPVKLRPGSPGWEAFDLPTPDGWQGLGATIVETELYVLGGRTAAELVTASLAYQAIFTLQLP